ncbi:MAG TPA: AI-2E family transporter, partial [Polyangiales bacterium]|nr:AI-2E family transporter [Polyangiales bacterium]
AGAPRRPLAATGLFVIALGAVLYFGRAVFLPLTLALMLSFVFSPLVRVFDRIRIPKEISSAVIVLGLVGGIGFAGVQLAAPASEWATRLPKSLLTIEHRIAPLRRPVDEANKIAARVERLTDMDPRAPGVREVRLQETGLASDALGTVATIAAQAAVVVFALYFMLIWGDRLLERVICLVPDISDRDRASQVIRHIERRMSLYLGTITFIYACLGVAVGVSVHLLGLPNPVLWGVLAACLHFIPYVGSAIGIAVVGLASLATFPNLHDALLPPLAYLALTTIEGNIISPIVLGRTCALSPLVIFAWLVFWGWLWGMFGAVIAVPMLMLIKITCEQSRALTPIAAFLKR